MSEIKRVGDLDIGQDLEFQNRSWTVQRVGWIVMAFLIIIGLFGVFGSGIAADATVGEDNSLLRIEYERFVRSQSETTLVMRLGTGANSVRFDREYLEAVQIENISPTPERVDAAYNYETYVFNSAATEVNKPLIVKFYVQLKKAGVISGQVSVDNETRNFRQYVYP